MRSLCAWSISMHLPFSGIFLFHNEHPALRIPPLPKSCPGVRVLGPFASRVTRVRVPVAHAPRPGPTPGAPPATPGERICLQERGFGGSSASPPREIPHCEHPLEQSTKPRGLAWRGTANPRASVERGRETGTAVSCQTAPIPRPRHSGGLQGALRTTNLDSRFGRR